MIETIERSLDLEERSEILLQHFPGDRTSEVHVIDRRGPLIFGNHTSRIAVHRAPNKQSVN